MLKFSPEKGVTFFKCWEISFWVICTQKNEPKISKIQLEKLFFKKNIKWGCTKSAPGEQQKQERERRINGVSCRGARCRCPAIQACAQHRVITHKTRGVRESSKILLISPGTQEADSSFRYISWVCPCICQLRGRTSLFRGIYAPLSVPGSCRLVTTCHHRFLSLCHPLFAPRGMSLPHTHKHLSRIYTLYNPPCVALSTQLLI